MTWIKMRKDLKGDPAVLWLAGKLQTRPETVIGYLHSFWCWCDDQIADGDAIGVTLSALGDALALPGFPELLCKVGWLRYDDCGEFPMITIPNFERHMSESAKKRAESAKRMERKRRKDSLRKSYTKRVTREEKRREEKRISLSSEVSNETSCARDCAPAIDDVILYCQERKYRTNPQRFIAYYQARGWKFKDGSAIENWRAAVDAWESSGVNGSTSESKVDAKLKELFG